MKKDDYTECNEECIQYKEEEEEEEVNEEDYKKSILDLSLSIQTRVKLIKRYYKENKNDAIEIISRISSMYHFSGTKLLEQYLIYISLETEISSFLKIEAVKGLLSFNEYEEDIDEKDEEYLKIIKIESNNLIKERNKKRYITAYNSLNIVCCSMDNDLSTPYKINIIYMLMENEEYYIDACKYFLKIINENKIDCDYRYKAILSLENKKDKIPKINYYINNSLINFILNEKNLIMYRILSGQYLLIKRSSDDNKLIENILLQFAENEENEYNLRADAADVLLSLGSDEMKVKGREIIIKLGGGSSKTIFENKQNVHVKEIEKSVLNILETLCSIPIMKNDNEFINFDYVEEKIINLSNNNDEIKISLNRIKMDRNLYSSLSITLSIILIKLWSYIQNDKYKDEMEERLLQELVDMSGTCSSGFISRLVNTLSGFGDYISIHISFEDQIISNFSGRLNSYIRDIMNNDSPFRNNKKLYDEIQKLYLKKNTNSVDKNTILEYFYDLVLEEMISSEYKNKSAFLLFFRTYMSKIREEMFKEFIEYITESEFDLYFRKALSYYDGIRDII